MPPKPRSAEPIEEVKTIGDAPVVTPDLHAASVPVIPASVAERTKPPNSYVPEHM